MQITKLIYLEHKANEIVEVQIFHVFCFQICSLFSLHYRNNHFFFLFWFFYTYGCYGKNSRNSSSTPHIHLLRTVSNECFNMTNSLVTNAAVNFVLRFAFRNKYQQIWAIGSGKRYLKWLSEGSFVEYDWINPHAHTWEWT